MRIRGRLRGRLRGSGSHVQGCHGLHGCRGIHGCHGTTDVAGSTVSRGRRMSREPRMSRGRRMSRDPRMSRGRRMSRHPPCRGVDVRRGLGDLDTPGRAATTERSDGSGRAIEAVGRGDEGRGQRVNGARAREDRRRGPRQGGRRDRRPMSAAECTLTAFWAAPVTRDPEQCGTPLPRRTSLRILVPVAENRLPPAWG